MPLVAFLFVALVGTSINSHNAGGVKSFSEARDNVIAVVTSPEPADFYKLND